MQGRFKMEYRLFTIVRYNYNYRDYNSTCLVLVDRLVLVLHLSLPCTYLYLLSCYLSSLVLAFALSCLVSCTTCTCLVLLTCLVLVLVLLVFLSCLVVRCTYLSCTCAVLSYLILSCLVLSCLKNETWQPPPLQNWKSP
jgi:hypothetical protein